MASGQVSAGKRAPALGLDPRSERAEMRGEGRGATDVSSPSSRGGPTISDLPSPVSRTGRMGSADCALFLGSSMRRPSSAAGIEGRSYIDMSGRIGDYSSGVPSSSSSASLGGGRGSGSCNCSSSGSGSCGGASCSGSNQSSSHSAGSASGSCRGSGSNSNSNSSDRSSTVGSGGGGFLPGSDGGRISTKCLIDSAQRTLHKDYIMRGKEFGRGRYGVVRTCVDRVSGKVMACKTISKDRLKDEQQVEELQSEISLMRKLAGHPHIVQAQAVYEDDAAVYVVMELCMGGDLFDLLSHQDHLAEPEACRLFRKIVEAVRLCHSQRVVHRDIKPENILLSDAASLQPKLADFGMALELPLGSAAQGLAGSTFYMAPEVVQGQLYSFPADVWSLGVLLYIMLSGILPFWGENDDLTYESVCSGHIDFSSRQWQLVSPGAKDLIQWMCKLDPCQRPSADEILSHSWLARAAADKGDDEGSMSGEPPASMYRRSSSQMANRRRPDSAVAHRTGAQQFQRRKGNMPGPGGKMGLAGVAKRSGMPGDARRSSYNPNARVRSDADAASPRGEDDSRRREMPEGNGSVDGVGPTSRGSPRGHSPEEETILASYREIGERFETEDVDEREEMQEGHHEGQRFGAGAPILPLDKRHHRPRQQPHHIPASEHSKKPSDGPKERAIRTKSLCTDLQTNGDTSSGPTGSGPVLSSRLSLSSSSASSPSPPKALPGARSVSPSLRPSGLSSPSRCGATGGASASASSKGAAPVRITSPPGHKSGRERSQAPGEGPSHSSQKPPQHGGRQKSLASGEQRDCNSPPHLRKRESPPRPDAHRLAWSRSGDIGGLQPTPVPRGETSAEALRTSAAPPLPRKPQPGSGGYHGRSRSCEAFPDAVHLTEPSTAGPDGLAGVAPRHTPRPPSMPRKSSGSAPRPRTRRMSSDNCLVARPPPLASQSSTSSDCGDNASSQIEGGGDAEAPEDLEGTQNDLEKE